MTFIAVISAITLANCAYFNIFYNANKYYNMGIAPLKANKSPNTAYLDKAIEKSSKILEFHPKSSYVDDALMIIGKSYMYKGEFTKAIRKFNELQTYYEESPYIDESTFYTAKTYIMQGEMQIAKVYLNQLIETESQWREEAVFEMADIYRQEKQYMNAANILKENSSIIDNKNMLYFREAGLYYAADSADASFNALKKVKMGDLPIEHRFDYIALNVSLLIDRNDYEDALRMINENEKYFASIEQKNSLLLMKTKILRKMERIEEAVALIDDIVVQDRNVPLKDSLLFEKGLILEQQTGNMDKAIEVYRIIVNENKQSSLLPEAQMKIMSLELMQSLQSDSIMDDEKIAKNRFLLAEVNYLSLHRTDEAVKLYAIVKDSYPESYYAPKSLYALSYIYVKDYNDTATARVYLNELINEYPDSDIYLDAGEFQQRMNGESVSEE